MLTLALHFASGGVERGTRVLLQIAVLFIDNLTKRLVFVFPVSFYLLRRVIVHEQADLSDTPRFLLTDARHGEVGRVMRVGSYRWPVEIFHAFCKQAVGLEASQVRKEEAVKRHFRLSGVAPSRLQRTPAGGRKSERLAFAEDPQQTVGQKRYTLTRDAVGQGVQLLQGFFAQGQSYEHVLERLMPA